MASITVFQILKRSPLPFALYVKRALRAEPFQLWVNTFIQSILPASNATNHSQQVISWSMTEKHIAMLITARFRDLLAENVFKYTAESVSQFQNRCIL
jgi:hypothetical protein